MHAYAYASGTNEHPEGAYKKKQVPEVPKSFEVGDGEAALYKERLGVGARELARNELHSVEGRLCQ